MPLDGEGHETDQNTESPELERFDDHIPSVIGGLRLAGRADLAEWVEDNVYRPSDLVTEEGQQKLKEIGGLENNFGPLIVKGLQGYLDAERAEQERVAKEKADAEQSRIRAEEKARLEQERAERRQRDERKATRAAILEEERQAKIAAGQKPDPVADAEVLVSRAVDVIEKGDIPLEQQAALADEAIEAYGAAQQGSKQRPIDVDPDEFLKQFNTKEE
jgi:hypothetical protein